MELRASSRGWAGQPLESTVIASRRITPRTHALTLEKPAGFSFRPTQFTFLSLQAEEGTHTRPMSIATSPTRPNLEYAVHVSDSPFKRAFASLRPGDAVSLQGPFGRFLLRDDRPAVLLAGGIGITPLKGMAEYASDKALPIQMRLVYSNRAEEEIAYRVELQELERRNPRFRVLHTLTGGGVARGWEGSLGRIGVEHLNLATRGVDRPVYYICGRSSLVADMASLLSDSGVPAEDVIVEVFRGYGV
jgi:ferredoxin-NADP reductase